MKPNLALSAINLPQTEKAEAECPAKVAPEAKAVNLSVVRNSIQTTLDVVGGRKGEKGKQGENFLRKARNLENKLCAVYDTLPQRHPITRYLYTLFDRLETDHDGEVVINVMSNDTSVNSFVLENGSVFVSLALLEFCDSEEELLFILSHEYNHFKNAHFKKAREISKDWDKPVETLAKGIGMGRYNEYESDIKAMLEMDKKGLNAYGGIRFFTKFYEQNKFSATNSDLSHGSSLDRTINMSWVTKLMDLKDTSMAFTPIPESIRKEIGSSRRAPWADSLSDRTNLGRFDLLANNAPLQKLIVILEGLNGFKSKELPELERKLLQGEFKVVYAQLAKALSAKLKLSASEIQTLVAVFPRLLLGLRLSAVGESTLDPYLKSICSPADVDRLIQVLDPAHFEALDLFAENNVLMPEKEGDLPQGSAFAFVNSVSMRLLRSSSPEMPDVEAHLKAIGKLSKHLKGFFKERGCGNIQLDRVWYGLILREAYLFLAKVDPGASERLAKIAKRLKWPVSEAEIHSYGTQRERGESHGTQKEGNKKRSENNLGETFSIGVYARGAEGLSGESISRTDRILRGEMGEEEAVLWIESQKPEAAILEIGRMNTLVAQNWDFMTKDRSLGKEGKMLKRYSDFVEKAYGTIAKKGYWKTALDQVRDFHGMFIANGFVVYFYDVKPAIVTKPRDLEEIISIYEQFAGDSGWALKRLGLELDGEDGESRKIVPEAVLLLRAWCGIGMLGQLRQGLDRGDSRENIQELMDRILQRIDFDFSQDIYDETEGLVVREAADAFIVSIFERFSQEFSIEKPEDAKFILSMAFFVPDLYLSHQMKKAAISSLMRNLDFQKGMDLLFARFKKHIYDAESAKMLSEEKAVTHEQIEKVMGKMMAMVAPEEMDFKKAGIATGLDVISDFNSDKLQTLISMMTADSDSKFKGLMYSSNNHPDTLDYMLRGTYLADEPVRYALLRKILTGRHGVLVMSQSRIRLVDYFMGQFVKGPESNGESDLKRFLSQILVQFASRADIEDLYFMIFPILLRRFLVIPSKPSTWREAIWNRIETKRPIWARDMWGEYFEETEADSDEKEEEGIEDGIVEYDSAVRQTKDERYAEFNFRTVPDIQAFVDNEIVKIEGGDYEDKYEESDSEKDRLMLIHKSDYYLLKLLEAHSAKPPESMISVMDFVLEIAKNLGSPGIRFLQLLGQYVVLPPAYQQKFSEVYDQVFGQFKVNAHETLKREWPKFKNEIAEMRAPIGGGSLMTVYEVLSKGGERQVLKVINPNAEMKSQKIYKVLIEVFRAMGPEYELAMPIIEEIRDWVGRDINFKGFLESDRRFHAMNHGFSSDGYSIKVPRSMGPENKYFKREEFIEGDNLTQWDKLREQGHDLKAIVSVVVKNFFRQFEAGLVHSDVHPGNFRVTAAREVAILDRNFFLEFSEAERGSLMGIIQSIGSQRDFSQKIIQFLCPEKNESELQSAEDDLVNHLGKLGEEGDPMRTLVNAIVHLKKNGVSFPLKFTLLVKNILGLDSMAKKAGFEGGVVEVMF